MAKVSYVTKYKQLVLVKTPMGIKDSVGNKVKSIRAEFMPGPYGSMYSTDKVEMQEWLEGHEYMALGKIQRFDPETAEKVAGAPVISGGVTSTPAKAEPVAPAEGPKAKIRAAKVK